MVQEGMDFRDMVRVARDMDFRGTGRVVMVMGTARGGLHFMCLVRRGWLIRLGLIRRPE